MGLGNYTGRSDDDTNGSGSGAGGGLPAGFSLPGGLAGFGQGGDDEELAKAMLVDYNQKHATSTPALFRDRVIEQALAVLIGKTKPNALLVGPPGVGKTNIAEDIARRIAMGDPLIPDKLKNHTVYELPLSNLVAGSGLVGALEEKVQAIVAFASDPSNKVILFMDEIHQLTTGGEGGTYAKIAQILKPAMSRGELQIIGATTTQEARSLDDDPAFNRRFTRLVVDELTPAQTVDVLGKIRPVLIAHYENQLFVSDEVLQTVVRVADENSNAGSHRPDSAITLLDRAMADRVLEHKRLITRALADGDQALAQTLQATNRFPLTDSRVLDVARRMQTGNAEKHDVDVQVLRQELTTRLRGQDSILETLIDRIARDELSVFPRKTPMAWLFAGASGVGKTETAKIVAAQRTGQEPIILNMTEFHHSSALARIIGAPPGYIGSNSNAELPFDSLESNPHRVILLDEFEKADRAIQRLFLQALDEGYITTARGKRVDFSKALIIATTNAARESLDGRRTGFSVAGESVTISNRSLNTALAQHFDAELLGRFSLVVGFNPIDESTYADVITTRYVIEHDRIAVTNPRLASSLPAVMPDQDVQKIVLRTFVREHGARPAAHAVRAWIEDVLISAQAAQAASAAPVSGAIRVIEVDNPAEPD